MNVNPQVVRSLAGCAMSKCKPFLENRGHEDYNNANLDKLIQHKVTKIVAEIIQEIHR